MGQLSGRRLHAFPQERRLCQQTLSHQQRQTSLGIFNSSLFHHHDRLAERQAYQIEKLIRDEAEKLLA